MLTLIFACVLINLQQQPLPRLLLARPEIFECSVVGGRRKFEIFGPSVTSKSKDAAAVSLACVKNTSTALFTLRMQREALCAVCFAQTRVRSAFPA